MTPPDLLLLHGALGAADQFKELLHHIEKAGKVHTLDFEGHGHAELNSRPFKADYFRDKMVTFDETINTYRLLPNAELQIFPATLHPIEQISIGMLAASIISFFNT